VAFSLNKEFLKNSATLIGGTVIAQAIPLLLQPFLRRYYSTEDFGAMAIYLNLFGIITIVSALRYEAAIMLPKSDREAANVLGLSVALSIITNLIIFLLLLLFAHPFGLFLGLPKKYINYLLFLPASGLSYSCFQAINYWLIRQKAFNASTKNKISRRFAEGLIQLIAGLKNINGGLFFGDLAGNLANILTGTKQLFSTSFYTNYVSYKKIKWAFKKYREFPLYNTLPTFASSVATTLPYLFISKYYSTQAVAQVDLCRLALSVPLVFISGTVSQVLFQDITHRKANGLPIISELFKIALLLFGVFIIEFLIILFAAPTLFAWVFGEPYAVSGEIARVMIFSFGVTFFSSTFSFILISFQKLKINALWQLSYLVAISCLYFFNHLPLMQFIYSYAAIDIIWQLILLLIIIGVIKKYKPSTLAL